jgi:hypothetical protein
LNVDPDRIGTRSRSTVGSTCNVADNVKARVEVHVFVNVSDFFADTWNGLAGGARSATQTLYRAARDV